jgi:hypothetical protein
MIATSDRRPGRVGPCPSCDPRRRGARHVAGVSDTLLTALPGLWPFRVVIGLSEASQSQGRSLPSTI